MIVSASAMIRSISSLDRRHVVDEAGYHAARPDAGVHVALLHDARINASHFAGDFGEGERRSERPLLLQQAIDGGVPQHALGVAQRPHDEPRVEFARVDQRPLDVLVHRRLFRGDEARPHVDAVGAERERGDERPSIRHATRGNERNPQLFGGARQQDEIRHVVFARMATALEAVDAHSVAPY